MKWKVASLLFCIVLIWNCGGDKKSQGQRLYDYHCSNCHMNNGEGLGALYPPLAEADYFINHEKDIPCIVRNGLEGPIEVNGTTYNQAMAGIKEINPVEMANLMNYMMRAFYDRPDYFISPEKVRSLLEQCE